ncbi:alpha/beta fold hydrolase [Solirubrobacter deserti]|uniref:Alpha/beta hydrolase n=1 Tax=Solirubrobacter deserti TaxID=2282478 RepID=A0ABT4RH08_9ACTN|nr:alpha/beta fold hydrolase [Solirubrobacter deserti]MDA0137816.1 alpha/beta hydrolase [Solirubrobacter deserti]
MHTILVPGLLCSPRLYEPVLPAVWGFGAVTIADTRRDDSIAGIAARLLAGAPERFALVGLSMGGYVALEVMRQAPSRVAALALMSTSARSDSPEQTAARREQLGRVEAGRFDEVVDAAFPKMVAESRVDDEALLATSRAMAAEVGPDVYVRQQEAVIARADSRPLLASIACPTTVVHGREDQLIAFKNGEELAAGIPGAVFAPIEGCGHTATLERPAECAAALGALLARA